jgi:hypothetical protein
MVVALSILNLNRLLLYPLRIPVYFSLPQEERNLRLDHDPYTQHLVSMLSIFLFPVVDIPNVNDTYHSLALLDAPNAGSHFSSLAGWPSTIYQAMDNEGNMVCLRRLAGFSLAADEAIHNIEPWTQIKSSGMHFNFLKMSYYSSERSLHNTRLW